MEEQTPQPTDSENLSARSATALRGLEERARSALAASRDQVSRLEADITARLEVLATALVEQQTADSETTADTEQAHAEIDRLANELAQSQATWLTERDALEKARNELAQQVVELEIRQQMAKTEVERLRSEIARLNAEYDRTQVTWTAERAALEKTRDELERQVIQLEADHRDAKADSQGTKTEVDRLTDELAQSRSSWLAERATLEKARDELEQRITELEVALRTATADSEGTKSEIDRLTDELTQSRSTWLAERAALEKMRDDLSQQVAVLEAEHRTAKAGSAETQTEIDRLSDELTNSRSTWLAERLALEKERDDISKKLTKAEADQRAAKDEWRNQLADFELKLREQQSVWNEQRAEWAESRTSLERERDALQQKFELALEDVQRFRGRVAELEQDLARRPEANQTDSAELVALRAERDALSERVAELERQPAAPVDSNTESQMADLQRRFELAVEDVRDLKTANAKLEAQLASAGKRPAAADAGSMDWESQKRRLLASLENDTDSSHDPAAKEERATIAGTIEMTDAIVADKDREIAELKSQLAQGVAADTEALDEERTRKLNEIVDSDEVIAEHRKRVAQLEREMEEKLRAAELDLSVERAKMARQKAELEELRAELEAQRNEFNETGVAPGMPKRRWLSKLGLSGEES